MVSHQVPDEYDPVVIAVDLGARLERIGATWVVAGSIASSVHGEPRATQDVDFVVALRSRHVKPLVSSLLTLRSTRYSGNSSGIGAAAKRQSANGAM